MQFMITLPEKYELEANPPGMSKGKNQHFFYIYKTNEARKIQ